MAVNKTTATVTATWTAAQLASGMRTALIDAGLMTEWHASFLSGSIENRVLEVNYAPAKTYGKTYYWFQFTTAGIFVAYSTGWNTGSNIPAGPAGAGTQYLDWFSTTTNATTNHNQLITLVNTTSCNIVQYSAGNYAFFLLRQGTNFSTFSINKPGVVFQSWCDLDRGHHSGMIRYTALQGGSNNLSSVLSAYSPFRLRRTWEDGLVVGTATAAYSSLNYINSYVFVGSSGTTQGLITTPNGCILPQQTAALNPAQPADFRPVFSGLQFHVTLNERIHPDFGLASVNTAVASIQDTYTVTAEVEVYEMILISNLGANGEKTNPLILARTVG